MKLLATESRLNKCIKKHASNPGEPWHLVLKDAVKEIRRAFRSGNGLMDIKPPVRQALAAQLSAQLALSNARPMFATYQQQPVARQGGRAGKVQPSIHFITPARILLICERIDEETCQLVTAYIPHGAKSWKDAAKRLLNKFCKAKGSGYQLPTEPKRIRQGLDGFQRDVEVSELQLHILQQFGLRECGETPLDGWEPPPWREAEPYESTKPTRPRPRRNAKRFTPRPPQGPLRGGLN